MALLPRLPLFAATLTLLTFAMAVFFLTGSQTPAAQAQTATPTPAPTTAIDYDSNDDGLIEISNLAQLNALRWDLDGNGAIGSADNANYAAAFPNAAAGMGCPDGSDADTNPDPCLGYELKSDLTFDSNNDGSVTIADSGGLYWNNGAGWSPMGDGRNYPYTGQFQGRGKTISHLFINNSSLGYVGLFGAVGRGGSVTGLALEDAKVSSSVAALAGSLAGSNAGTITASYATGSVAGNINTRHNIIVGGLVGFNSTRGMVQASFAEVAVSGRNSSAAAIAGGLVGQNSGSIRASYAAGAVSVQANTRFAKVGGLVGSNGGPITASYARGAVSATGSGVGTGGLIGGSTNRGSASNSYWDTTTSGQSGSAGGAGQTTSALQSPTGYGYTGIYAAWNLNLDGAAGGDDPWYFRGANQYPILAYGAMRDFPLYDYDADNDRLIEVNNLAQLNAIRWDLNTDGIVAVADQGNYTAAFPGAVAGLGCANGTTAASCNGYELAADLDFDTDGDGDVDAADSGGRYWNGGRGWESIGGDLIEGLAKTFQGTFQGNGKTIANLYINQPASGDGSAGPGLGLFETVGPAGIIAGVKLRDVNIRTLSHSTVGPLVVTNAGTIQDSSATGRINVDGTGNAGGLVGGNSGGTITGSYAQVDVAGNIGWGGGLAAFNSCFYGTQPETCGSIVASYSSGAVGSTLHNPLAIRYDSFPNLSTAHVGGLVGQNWAAITAAYSLGPVQTTGSGAYAGGLVGLNGGRITAAYSRSPVKVAGDSSTVGGLVGANWKARRGGITSSYALGPVVATGTTPSVGDLVGRAGQVDGNGQLIANSQGMAVDSYWDVGVSGQSGSALGTGVNGPGPTGYTGIYANWNLNLDGVAGNDDPWFFVNRQYPILKYGGLEVANQVQFYLWEAPAVGRTARTHWHIGEWLTRARRPVGYIWERSADGITWTVIRDRNTGVGAARECYAYCLIEPYEANQRFRVRRMSVERGWVYGYTSPPAGAWGGPTAALTFASGHTAPQVGQAVTISGSAKVKWIRCNDAADNGCEVIVAAATSYTPAAADQGKYLYAYRYYDNSSGVKTMGKTAVIGPVAAAATP